MIIRLLTFLAVLCCFSFYSNAQESQSTSDGSITTNNLLSNSDFDQSVFSSDWNWWQDSNAGLGHVYTPDKFINLKNGGVWQSTGLPAELDPNRMVSLNWQLEIMKNDLADLLEVRVGFGTGSNDWSLVLDMEDQVTQLHTWEIFSGSETFNSISSNSSQTGIWIYGKDIDGGSWGSGDFPAIDDIRLNMTYFEALDCSNPLNDPQCEGYQQAYTDQQCQQDPLYDSSCPGYDQAYEDQQCSIDSLYSPRCDGYFQAYQEQQCDLDSQYSISCPNYEFEVLEEFGIDSFDFEDFSGSDSGSDYDAFGNVEEEFIFEEEFAYEEEFIFDEPELEYLPELDEFVPEDVKEAIQELEELEEITEEVENERELFEEEINEDDDYIETSSEEISEERTQTRSSGSRIGLSVGLGTANSLVAGLITNSIESSQTSAAQGIGTDRYFESGQGSISTISGGGVSFSEFTDSVNDNQDKVNESARLPLLTTIDNNNNSNVRIDKKQLSLAERIAERVRKKNLDEQSGIFNKQITIIENIAAGNNLNKYYEERLADSSSWYEQKVIYTSKLKDREDSFYRLNSENYGLMKQIIRSQY